MRLSGLTRHAWLLLLPLTLYGVYVFSAPFSTQLAKKEIPISGLTTHQKLNIRKAVEKIDGIVMRPGDEFSFNRSVGPRNEKAGFYSAPSYVGSGSYSTAGGGICVVSSALYQDALLTGLKISQRVPHQRTMQTVEPGLDATVWYGGADLKFINDTGAPIQIKCKMDDDYLTATIIGSSRPPVATKLTRRETSSVNNQIAVEVFQHSGGQPFKLVSRDLYAVNAPKHRFTAGNEAVVKKL